MKKLTALLVAASLALGSSGSALADWGGHHHRQEFRPPMPPPFWHHREHRRGPEWIGPAAALAIAGLAVGAVAYSEYRPAPAPVYVAPPPPVRIEPAPGTWYYCASVGDYYPNTQYCPEGWRPVYPR